MYYIYKITNLLNSKIYIGYHYSLNIETDPYMGSGKLIMKAIKKYGKHNFKREILFSVETIQEALQKERELVDFEFVQDRSTYNCTLGGKGGFPFYSQNGFSHNKDKISLFDPIKCKVKYVNFNEVEKYTSLGFIIGSGRKDHAPVFNLINNKFEYVPKNSIPELIKTGNFSVKNTTSDKIVVHHNETKQLKYINPNDLEWYLSNGYSKGNVKSGINLGRTYVYNERLKKHKRILTHELDKFLTENPDYEIKRKPKPTKLVNVYNPETDVEKHINVLEESVESYLNIGYKLGSRSTYRIKPEKPKSINAWIYNPNTLKNKKILRIDMEKYILDGWIEGHYKAGASTSISETTFPSSS
jgi:hypothetical protein